MTAYRKNSFQHLISVGSHILNISLPDDSLSIFERYVEFLVSWNRTSKLTSLNDIRDIVVLHFLDSLTILKILPTATSSLLDVGTGPGFPGLILKIAQPHMTLWLLDSDPRKIVFLKSLVSHLDIPNVRFLSFPVQRLLDESSGYIFDAVVMRALSLHFQQMSKIPAILSPNALFIRMLGPRSFDTTLTAVGFRVAAYWAEYLPFIPVYRRVVGYMHI